jgi:HEPN domain-containing protein
MKTISKSFNPQKQLVFLGFLRNAYSDYLCARVLLNHNFIVQGAIFANTSTEKYFKAILTFRGEAIKRTHNITSFLPSIKNFDKKLYDELDKEFLKQIASCYILRYIDSAPKDFKLVLLRKHTLAKLDLIISQFETKFNFKKNGTDYKRQYELDKESNRRELFDSNYLLNNQEKGIFLSGIDDVYEIQMDFNGQCIEVYYKTDIPKN